MTTTRSEPEKSQAAAPISQTVWLFPVTYLLHLGEEYWGGEGFPSWLSRVAGATLSKQDFVTINFVGLIFMVVAVLLIRWHRWRWLLVGLGGVVLLNGLLHLAGTLLTRSYSPGLFSGMLCWIPLGVFTLYQAWHQTSRRSFWIGVIVALGLHALVSLIALFG